MHDAAPESLARDAGIADALLQPLGVIPTPGGPVLHMLRPGCALWPEGGRVGEVYFSEVLPGRVKAWKRHTRQTQRFAVPAGLLRIVLYDDRPGSPSEGALLEMLLGRPENYRLLCIPVGVWYGFTAMGAAPALICNCPDLPHDPTDGERLPQDTDRIPYRWSEEAAS